VIIITTVVPPFLLKRYFKFECVGEGGKSWGKHAT
jgi:hypothetical protein